MPTKEEDFQYFIDCFNIACELIAPHYFNIIVAPSGDTINRERVYCYELYHQLRGILGDSYPYKLDGELDKASHPIISSRIGAKKPDFIVHVPGTMRNNLIVIEVKPISERISRLTEDLETLQSFLSSADYYGALMIVYGADEVGNIEKMKAKLLSYNSSQIYLYWHKEPKTKAILLSMQ